MRVCNLTVKVRGPIRGPQGGEEREEEVIGAPLQSVSIEPDGTASYLYHGQRLRAYDLDGFREVA